MSLVKWLLKDLLRIIKFGFFREAKTKARLNYTEIVNTALKINKIK